MARKQYADAVDYYRLALKQGGASDPVLWNKIGIAHQQQGNFGAARDAYKKAIREQKDFAEAWNNLGTTYYLEKKAKKSLKYYRRAVELRPTAASFYVNLGSALYERKKYAEAVEAYRTALSLDPQVLVGSSSAATVLQTREADAQFYFYLAKVFASMGRAEEAVRYLRRALEDGFKKVHLLDEDPDIQKIHQEPAYLELRANPPVPIKD
jgi:tetratricopeptide (TPR) repeat protein